MPEREWTGGAYEDREGITVTYDHDGIEITGWYDGGCGLSVVANLTWDELAQMKDGVNAASDR